MEVQHASWKYSMRHGSTACVMEVHHATDLRNTFYQIPLTFHSMKDYDVVTTFKWIRVYATYVMGMSVSQTVL